MKTFSQRNKLHNGFSLVEVMVAMLVLGVGMVSIAKFQGTVLRDTSMAKERAQAAQLAQAKLAELGDFATTNEFTSTLISNIDNSVADSDSVAGSTTNFNRNWSITPENGGKSARVKVRVRWQDSNGDSQDVYVTSVISNDIPLALDFTDLTPPPDKDNEPPADTVDTITVPSNSCQCDQTTTTASYQPEEFFGGRTVRVGMMGGHGGMETTTTTTTTTTSSPADSSDECNECCTQAQSEGDISTWQEARAPLGDNLFAGSDASAAFAKVADYADRSLDAYGWQPGAFIKPSLPRVSRAIEQYMQNTGMSGGGMSGGGMSGGGGGSTTTTTTTYYAYCTFVTETTTTSSGTTTSSRMHGMHKKYKTVQTQTN